MKKGYVSFMALVIAMISSLFVFYFINLSNINSYSVIVQRSLNKSLKSVDLSDVKNTENIEMFQKILNANLRTDNKIYLSPQEIQLNSGENFVFYKYDGYEILRNTSYFKKTPKIIFFSLEPGISTIDNVQSILSNNKVDIDSFVKDSIFIEMTGENPRFKENKATVVGIIEMPLNVFRKEIRVHRFYVLQD